MAVYVDDTTTPSKHVMHVLVLPVKALFSNTFEIERVLFVFFSAFELKVNSIIIFGRKFNIVQFVMVRSHNIFSRIFHNTYFKSQYSKYYGVLAFQNSIRGSIIYISCIYQCCCGEYGDFGYLQIA